MATSAQSSGRSLEPAQVVSLLLVFLLLSITGGVLTAGFAMPLVGATSAVTDASADLFEELPSDFNILPPSQISRIQSSNGTEIAQFWAENRIVVPLDKISPNVQNAVVAVEDRRFYQHKGVDPTGMVRALVKNAAGGSTQGASTLTQQYVKNVLIEAGLQANDPNAVEAARAQSVSRKLREAKYALTVEQKYTKQQILEGYLNIAAFGPSTYGIEAASEHYFSHPAADLSIGEAALLAGLTNAPSAYDPIEHPELATERRDTVLQKMYEEQFITAEERDAAMAQPVSDMLHVKNQIGGCGGAGSAAYFCEYVVQEILNSDLYGKDLATRRQLLLRGGLTIHTTLDLDKQAAANDAVENWIPTRDPSNIKTALVSVEPGTGKIVAMAQNTPFGEPTDEDPYPTTLNFSADAAHGGSTSNGFQVGSSFKTFVLAEWYRQGKSGYQRISGAPRNFYSSDFTASCAPDVGIGTWPVANANPSENGYHTVVQATAQSVNVTYVNMLTELDTCKVTGLAASLGITNGEGQPIAPNPSVVLGTANATPLAMANAYATFAAHGVYCTPIAIDSIVNDEGNSLPVPSADCTQVMEPKHADQVSLTLASVLQRGGTAAGSALSRPAAGKTGTTEEQDNAWFVGYVPQLSTAVWIGHSGSYTSMDDSWIGGRYFPTMYGSDAAAPEWRQYMEAALADTPVENFPQVSLGLRPQVRVPVRTPDPEPAEEEQKQEEKTDKPAEEKPASPADENKEDGQ
nr:transglycosylase domain-containing protein [Actinomyces vulturis]